MEVSSSAESLSGMSWRSMLVCEETQDLVMLALNILLDMLATITSDWTRIMALVIVNS